MSRPTSGRSLAQATLAAVIALALNCATASRHTPNLPRDISMEKDRQLAELPAGLSVVHVPNPVSAQRGGRSGRQYTWLHRTTVTAANDTVRITEFGAFVSSNGRWVFSTFARRPFTPSEFAEWYGCPDALIVPSRICSDSVNWTGADFLRSSRTRWYYIGVTPAGRRVKGEAIVDELASVDTTRAPGH